MSGTIKAGVLQHPDSVSPNVTLNDDGSVDVSVVTADAVVARNTPGHNLLHNGAMQVHQRGTSTASITTGGYYTADRWTCGFTTLGTWTQSVESDAPTGSGFRKSLKFLCTTADASPAAGDLAIVQQKVEGQNLQAIKKGTAEAQQLTVSFWVKSNKTGTYVVDLYDNDNARLCAATYTVAASATWEEHTVTFPADLSGALDNVNAVSLTLEFWLAAGSNYTSGTLATTWAAYSAANYAVGQTNLAAADNNYWQVTGVQLEVGSAATGFEHKDYATELAECQRYYYQLVNGVNQYVGTGWYTGTTSLVIYTAFPVTMRVYPAITSVDGSGYWWSSFNGASETFDAIGALSWPSPTGTAIVATSGVSGTANAPCIVGSNNASARLGFTADL